VPGSQGLARRHEVIAWPHTGASRVSAIRARLDDLSLNGHGAEGLLDCVMLPTRLRGPLMENLGAGFFDLFDVAPVAGDERRRRDQLNREGAERTVQERERQRGAQSSR
jgi:hypothetical protein